MVYYMSANNEGLKEARSLGDGTSIELIWYKAYATIRTNSVAYNIYVDTAPITFENTLFDISPTYVSIGNATTITLTDLTPGQLYHFAVRAIEYNPFVFDFTLLPKTSNGNYYYPESPLAANMTTTSDIVPLVDVENFPSAGVVRVGAELIRYTGVDPVLNHLIVPGGSNPTDGYIIDQGGGHYYLPSPGNVGTGIINGLTLASTNVFTETWTVLCVFDGYVSGDGYVDGYSSAGYGQSKFEAIGSISGIVRDAYGEPIVWNTYGQTVSNGILSFSIVDNPTLQFHLGDSFIIKTSGGLPGVGSGRGWNDTLVTEHLTDGYDGTVFWDPSVIFFPVVSMEHNTVVFECQSRFDIVKYNPANGSQGVYLPADGYHQVLKDLLNTDLTGSDGNVDNTSFPVGYYFGYQRTDPVALLTGACIGSYIGGQQGCIDGYTGQNMAIRGLDLQEVNNQRQEELLTLTGEPVCLLRRVWIGITCDCYIPGREYPENRCASCFGTGKVIGWRQFFNPRRSDSRILVRFSPADDKVDSLDTGLESVLDTNGWTIVFPAVHERDILVRFDEDGNDEFRYEILSVNRNKMLISQSGAQKMALKRIRKTDPSYQIPVFRDTSKFPTTISTTVGSAIPAIPPHSHTIYVNEKSVQNPAIVFNQTTSMDAGHNHVVWLNPSTGIHELRSTLGHNHQIVIPSDITFPAYPFPDD